MQGPAPRTCTRLAAMEPTVANEVAMCSAVSITGATRRVS
jgi:hypothetical protein